MPLIRIYLEYQCYPMWVYNENGELVDNDLVEELKNDVGIDRMLLEIQSIYDGLFEDNATNFEYKGFMQESDKHAFMKKIENVISMVVEKIGDRYFVENKVTL